MEVTMTSASVLDSGLLTPDLTTPEQVQASGVVRGRLQYLDSLTTPPLSSERGRHDCKAEDPGYVFMPVDCDVDSLHDWGSREKADSPRGAKLRVNNTDIAVFRYGERVIATQARCPHAGGPLYSGEIEELPDRSLCVRCPWHKWAFCVSGRNLTRRKLFTGLAEARADGECVWPPGREEAPRVKVFPAVVSKTRKSIKIGFENVNEKTLFGESF